MRAHIIEIIGSTELTRCMGCSLLPMTNFINKPRVIQVKPIINLEVDGISPMFLNCLIIDGLSNGPDNNLNGNARYKAQSINAGVLLFLLPEYSEINAVALNM